MRLNLKPLSSIAISPAFFAPLNLFFQNPDFRWVQGQDHVEGFKVPDAHRFTNNFCRTCGGILPRREPAPGFVAIPAGSLDRASEFHDGVEEKVHIYVGSKAPWYEICDSLPQIDETSPTP
jgi:hypothetical protein